jgi:hypothetical protein
MSEFPFSCDKILLCDPQKNRSTCHIFISHQSLAEEKSLGRLFMVAEIKSSDSINPEIINHILETVKNNYYNTDDLNIETAFEKALEKVNQKIADMIGDYDTNWLDRFNGVFAILKGNVLHLSSIGNAQAFLVRYQRIVNIIQSTTEKESITSTINPLKAFSHIISGTLEPGDALLLSLPSLLDYLSQEKLKRTITDYNAHQAIGTIERLLSEDTATAAFAALIIKLEPETLSAASPVPPTPQSTSPAILTAPGLTPQSSMDDLLNKEAATGKILTPSLSSFFLQSIKKGVDSVLDFIRLKIFRQSPRRVHWQREVQGASEYSPTVAKSQKSTLAKTSRASRALAKVGAGIMGGFKSLANLVAKKERPSGIFNPPVTFPERISSTIVSFKRLSRLSKVLLFAAILVAFLLSQSIYSTANSGNTKKLTTNVAQTINSITQKITEAEAALSYKNEDGAKSLLTQAQDLLTTLPNKSKKDKATVSQLQSDINTQLQKTTHVVTINTPTVFVDLTKTDATTNAVSLTYVNKNIFTFDPAKKTIYGIAADATVTSYPLNNTAIQLLIPQSATKTVAILDATNSLLELNPSSKKTSSLTFSFGTTDINIAGAAYYQSRLYFLDIRSNQILKSVKGGTGYGTPSVWIKDSTDIRDAVSMAVDGNIYILNKNGTVLKMTSGQKQAWSLATIDPALTKANKIWTDITTEANLYVLDAAGKRIVEFTKDGKLLNQYTSPAFNNLKDLTVDIAGKTIYVLNDNQIISILFAS